MKETYTENKGIGTIYEEGSWVIAPAKINLGKVLLSETQVTAILLAFPLASVIAILLSVFR